MQQVVEFVLFLLSVTGALAGIAGASFALIFSSTTEIIKKLLGITRNKKKKHDKILALAKKKLNSTGWHGNKSWRIYHDYKGEKKFEKMKENVRNVSEKLKETNEIMRLNSVNSST